MIAGIFHKGSGLGDQLMRYVTTRTIADEKGYKWGMVYPENFKGESFMRIDMGSPLDILNPIAWDEKEVRASDGTDIRSYDPEINFIEDNSVIDGCFEDFKYWGHNLHNISKWLEVDHMDEPGKCLIGFRGGEFYTDINLGLPIEYWKIAITAMRDRGITIFEVHTDDIPLAKAFLGQELSSDTKYISDIGVNWRSMRFAKNTIIANSAFYIMPRLLSGGYTIAPRYWARRNTKTWARPASYYKAFTYL